MQKTTLTGLLVPGVLLILTFLTATIAGVQWTGHDPTELGNFHFGVTYATLLLAVLGAHELGHYVAARFHSVDSTLPFFLPFPPHFGLMPFGTLGAVIRLRSEIRDRNALLDIGILGPISGFVASVVILAVGFSTLPPIDYLYGIHPEYQTMTTLPSGGLTFGTNIAYSLLAQNFSDPGSFVPPMNELYHYPFLCVGWFGLFITALNLIPVAQLDGGHIIRAVADREARVIEIASLVVLVALGIAGMAPLFDLPLATGWAGWLVWAVVLIVMKRVSGLRGHSLAYSQDLHVARKFLAVIGAAILVVSFSPTPFSI